MSLVVANGAIYNRIIIPGTTRLLTPRRGPGQAGGLQLGPFRPPQAGKGQAERGSLAGCCPPSWPRIPARGSGLTPFLSSRATGSALLCFPPLWPRTPLAVGATRQDHGHAAAGLPVSLPLAEEQRGFGAGAQSPASPGSSSPRAPQGSPTEREDGGEQRCCRRFPAAPASSTRSRLSLSPTSSALTKAAIWPVLLFIFGFQDPRNRCQAASQGERVPAARRAPSAALPQLTAGSLGLPETGGRGAGDVHLPLILQGDPSSSRAGNMRQSKGRFKAPLGAGGWRMERAWLGHGAKVPLPLRAISSMLFFIEQPFPSVSPQ